MARKDWNRLSEEPRTSFTSETPDGGKEFVSIL
jgi:hypothetical protein